MKPGRMDSRRSDAEGSDNIMELVAILLLGGLLLWATGHLVIH
jgi:hypothetical protein